MVNTGGDGSYAGPTKQRHHPIRRQWQSQVDIAHRPFQYGITNAAADKTDLASLRCQGLEHATGLGGCHPRLRVQFTLKW